MHGLLRNELKQKKVKLFKSKEKTTATTINQ